MCLVFGIYPQYTETLMPESMVASTLASDELLIQGNLQAISMDR